MLSHTAEDALRTLDPSTFRKWAAYLKMKATFYEAHVSQTHSVQYMLTCVLRVCVLLYCVVG